MDEELDEKNFIKDEFSQSPNPFLLGLFFVAVSMIIFSSIFTWYNEHVSNYRKDHAFYQVTNREFTQFLRENPQFMKTNVSSKNAYLPGTDFIENINYAPQDADRFVEAPDAILFEYHVWNRLIDFPTPSRLIPLKEFKLFLEKNQEWEPKYWAKAPKEYVRTYNSIVNGTAPNELHTLSEEELPILVRNAFIGWKNYHLESAEIAAFSPKNELLSEMIKIYPEYSRNYWINIVKDSDPAYLETFSFGKINPKDNVPIKEQSSFLQLNLFNFFKSKEEIKSSTPQRAEDPGKLESVPNPSLNTGPAGPTTNSLVK